MLDPRASRFSLLSGLVIATACAEVGGTSDEPSDAAVAPSSGSYDAGASRPGSTSTGSGGTPSGGGGANGIDLKVNDASVGLDDLLNAGGALFGASDGGMKSPASKGDGGTPNKCQNAVCIDVFDCYLFHPDLTDCGFTACEGLVCK